MHDCRKTKEDLIDLVFNETDAEDELRLLEELELCRACSAEYDSMRQALATFDEAAPSLLPAAEFWTEHHARIEERIESASGDAKVVSFWRRTLRASFSVPVPLAAAAAILLAATTVVALRSFIFKSGTNGVPTEAAQKIQYVEVPVEKRVVEEKVVTRTVYVTKRVRENNQAAPSSRTLSDITAQNKDAGNAQPRATLNGFQPIADVNLKVIKGSGNNEK
jgi:anti-sigma factor RsiW